MLGERLDSMILKVFSNPNDSMILQHKAAGDNHVPLPAAPGQHQQKRSELKKLLAVTQHFVGTDPIS